MPRSIVVRFHPDQNPIFNWAASAWTNRPLHLMDWTRPKDPDALYSYQPVCRTHLARFTWAYIDGDHDEKVCAKCWAVYMVWLTVKPGTEVYPLK